LAGLCRLQRYRHESWVLAVAAPVALFGVVLALVGYVVVRAEWAAPALIVTVAGGIWGANLEALREKHVPDLFARLTA